MSTERVITASRRDCQKPVPGKLPRQSMPAQEPEIRVSNFGEVNQGYTEAQARSEAARCLRCRDPKCVSGCPVSVDIPAFIGALADGDLGAAVDRLRNANVLPCVTGRVCPQETQCEKRCALAGKGEPVAIGNLERYAADWARSAGYHSSLPVRRSGRRVAVVGSGPGGLSCAGELRRAGHDVTIFEALHAAGGVLRYGIPEFRLPKTIVDYELEKLQELGVEVVCNVIIGSTFSLDELVGKLGFQAVYLACGAGFPAFMEIPGENLKGVYSANEFLTRVNLMGAGPACRAATPVLTSSQVVVVGGGNTALDAVRLTRRLGAESATIAYRRSFEEIPARAEEVRHALEEGVKFELLVTPIEIVGDRDGWVKGLRCFRNRLSEPDQTGRRKPQAIPGSEFELPCKLVIEAIGTMANPLLTRNTPGLVLNPRGFIQIDASSMTSMPGIFAGGDIVRGAATVILAMGDGKRTAGHIHRYLGSL